MVEKMKIIIFDSSTLISLAMNGLLEEFRELRRVFKGKFLIPPQVKGEIIDRPIKIKRFELDAMKLEGLIEDKVLELPESVGVNEKELAKETQEILDKANNTFFGEDRPLHLIDLGETACLALNVLLKKKGIDSVVAVDERTTRSLGETQDELKEFLRSKLHTKISVKKENLKFFKQFKFIRSVELIYVAYKKGIIKLKNKNMLDALLFALKYKGCAISREGIKEMENLK